MDVFIHKNEDVMEKIENKLPKKPPQLFIISR